MKTKLLFLITTLFSLFVNAQLVELDNTGEENSGSISCSIAVYDNVRQYLKGCNFA